MIFKKSRQKSGEEMLEKPLLPKIEELQSELRHSRQENVTSGVLKLKNLFFRTRGLSFPELGLEFDDPLYGQVSVDPKIEPVLFHPLVQRLNHIRQLSFSYLRFPSANHTRFSHSLGVARNMRKCLETILRKDVIYASSGKKKFASEVDIKEKDKNEILLVGELAGLLHDIGHCPFGHAMDRYLGYRLDKYPHPDKYLSVQYIKDYLKECIEKIGIDCKLVYSVLPFGNSEGYKRLENEGIWNLISELIDSSLDLDRMDYVIRDSYHTALPQGMVAAGQIMEMVAPMLTDEGSVHLAFDESAISHIEHFIYARDKMYASCYEHDTKLAAELMLVKAVDSFLTIYEGSGLDAWRIACLTDDQLKSLILLNSSTGMPCFELISRIETGMTFKNIYSICLSPIRGVLQSALNELRKDLSESNLSRSRKEESEKRISDFVEFIKDLEKDIIESDETRAIKKLRQRDPKTLYTRRIPEIEMIFSEKIGLDENEPWRIAIYVPPYELTQPKEPETYIVKREGEGCTFPKLYQISRISMDLMRLFAVERSYLRVFASQDLSQEQMGKLKEVSKEFFGRE
jgi:HD superfamily phosphohydrolase